MTLADDIEGLFTNSKGGDIFSEKGLLALSDFKFYESVIFYTGVFLTFILIYGIITGRKKTKKMLNKSHL